MSIIHFRTKTITITTATATATAAAAATMTTKADLFKFTEENAMKL